ncbi:MAG: UPF0175 family protein [Fimbriimonadales bacterium]|nr:UPF0175 family protein [Fimbriimonadales bacterium]
MGVVISDEMLRAAQFDEAEFRIELAIWLYQQQRLSLGQAIEWSGVDRLEFQRRLRERNIPIHYDETDLAQDLNTIAELRA